MREHIDRATLAVLGWSLPEALDDEALKRRRFLPQSDLPDDRPTPTMLRHPTAAHFEALGFHGMAGAFDEQIADAAMADLGFEDRFVLVSDRESAWRDAKRLQARLCHAKLRVQAADEDNDFRSPRGIDRALVLQLAEGRWIADHVNLIITGLTGSGKTWLSRAFGHRAARDDDSVLCARTPRLLEDVAVARAGGRYLGPLGSLAKVRLLMLDDWAIKPMAGDQRHDLLKVAQDRCGRASTLIASQIPVAEWHAAIGEAALADATRAGHVDEAIKAAAWVAGGCLAAAPVTTPPTHRGERNWTRFRQGRRMTSMGR